MQTDTVKLWFTYILAAVVIIGGGAMLFVSRGEANTDFQLIISGLIGSAVTFVFGAESATRAVRSYQAGQAITTAANAPVDAVP